MLVIGHRGAAACAAENTLGSMQLAIDQGADGVEFDLRRLDDQIIVLHDDTVQRTTNGRGHYKSYAFSELRKLKTSNNESIPTLEEALSVVKSCRLINLEIKEAGIVEAVVAAVTKFTSRVQIPIERIVYSSFDVHTTTELAQQRGDARLGVLFEYPFDAALALARELDATSIHFSVDQIERPVIDRAHCHGLQAYVYTVNEKSDIQRCIELGVDGIFSDHPGAARQYINQLSGTQT